MRSLDIVIVNWNAGIQLIDCLKSIAKANHKDFQLTNVFIVDNASTDQSNKNIKDYNLPLTLISNKQNKGFAAACNQGAKNSKADYLLFLNPDTKLYYESLNIPILFMEKTENRMIGICGIQLVDQDGEYSISCARLPKATTYFSEATGLYKLFPKKFPKTFMTYEECNQNGFVDQVIGAYFLIRNDVFKMLDGFDERFFVYFEEVDLSLRAKALGYSSYYLSTSQAYHKCGGCSENIKPTRLYYSLRSRILYGLKHFNLKHKILLIGVTFFVEFFSRVFASIILKTKTNLRDTIEAYKKLIHFFIFKNNRT